MKDHEQRAGDPIIATTGACGQCHSVRSARVYHRDYPEARAEGGSPEEAASGLVDRLSRALDSAPDRWRSEPIRAAIADLRAFVGRGTNRAERPEETTHGDPACQPR